VCEEILEKNEKQLANLGLFFCSYISEELVVATLSVLLDLFECLIEDS
jgi:hypothetical protein